MFKNQILLKVDKRSTPEEDRIRKKSIKSDIFDNNLSVDVIIKKYEFKTITSFKEL